jgi:hypothetical protein
LPYQTPDAAVLGFSAFYGGVGALTPTTRAVVSINGLIVGSYTITQFISYIDFCSTSGSPVDTPIGSVTLLGGVGINVTFSNLSFTTNSVAKSNYTTVSSAVYTFNNCIFNGVSMDVGQSNAGSAIESYFLYGCQFYGCVNANLTSSGSLINLRSNTGSRSTNFYMTDCSLILPATSLGNSFITSFVSFGTRANLFSIGNIYSYDTMGGNPGTTSSTLVLYNMSSGYLTGNTLRSTNDVLSVNGSGGSGSSKFAIMYGSADSVITFHNLRLTYSASFAYPSNPSDGFLLPSNGTMTALTLNGSAITSGQFPSSLFIDPSVYGTALAPIIYHWTDTNGIDRHSTPLSNSSTVISAGSSFNVSAPTATMGSPSDYYITSGGAFNINFAAAASAFLNLKYQFYLINGSSISSVTNTGGSTIVGVTSKSSGVLTVYSDGTQFYTN